MTLLLCKLMILFSGATLMDKLTTIDLSVTESLHAHRLTALDPILNFLTETSYGLGALVPFGLFFFGFLKSSFSFKLKAYQYITAMVLNAFCIAILKYSINRQRPFITHSTIVQLVEASSPSFPSGHTSFAFTAAVTIGIIFRNTKLRMFVFLWAALVAYSRLAMGVHYLSDVVSSIVIGSTVSCLVAYIFGKNHDYLFLFLKRNKFLSKILT